MQSKFEISLDADQYRKQLDSLIQETRQAAAKMADELNIGKKGTGPAAQTVSVITKVSDKEDAEKLAKIVQALPKEKTIIVQAEVKGVEKVEQAKQKIESLPKTRTVEMKIEQSGNFSALEMTGKNLEKNISVRSEVSGLDQVQQLGTAVNKLPTTITVKPPPVEQWSKMNGIFQNLRSGFQNFTGSVKNASDIFISSGGALVLVEGFKSLIKIGQHFYGEWINGMKEAAAISERNAEC